MEILIIVVIAYIVIVFGFTRLVVPHFGFGSDLVPEIIPDSMLEKIKELKNKANTSKEKFLELSYDYLGNKYHSERLNTLFKFFDMYRNLSWYWNKIGFIHCQWANFLLKIFLVKSEFFKEDEIRPRYAFLNFIPHQYLQVKISNKWVDVDVDEKYKGYKIGEHNNKLFAK